MAYWTVDDGTAIHYERQGDSARETLLLLPGLLGAIASQWVNFVPLLAPSHNLLLVDLRGHGLSQNRQPALSPERMAQDIVSLLDHLELPRVHIAGYSLGGYLGLMLRLQQPQRVATLMLHATKFYWTREAVQKMHEQLEPDTMANKVPAYASQLVKEHGGSHWRILVRQAADLVAYLSEKGISEGMAAQADGPTLISVGDRDELVPLPEAQRLSRALPQGTLLVLPGVRHPYSSLRPVPLIPMMQEFHRSPEAKERRR
jgi:pimeloyl-ACP methyl ester carboxylesterase